MNDIAVIELRREEFSLAAVLLGRAYRDNPLTIALLGDDPDLRLRVGTEIHAIRIASATDGLFGIKGEDSIVGVCSFERPGNLTMSPGQQRQMLRTLSEAGADVLRKAQTMLTVFAKHAPHQPHWKLGPIAVSPDLQGEGLGSRMVQHFCAMADSLGDLAYLDTDQVKNVRLYERFGFEVIDEVTVLDVPMWFMTRNSAREGE